MKYGKFERIMSQKRMNRYLAACGGDSRKAMPLYRYNLQLSQETFTIISCFEVALRNRIAHHEPICFLQQQPIIDTGFILNEYQKIQTLFSWMGIDSQSLLYGLDHVKRVCDKIDKLK